MNHFHNKYFAVVVLDVIYNIVTLFNWFFPFIAQRVCVCHWLCVYFLNCSMFDWNTLIKIPLNISKRRRKNPIKKQFSTYLISVSLLLAKFGIAFTMLCHNGRGILALSWKSFFRYINLDKFGIWYSHPKCDHLMNKTWKAHLRGWQNPMRKSGWCEKLWLIN